MFARVAGALDASGLDAMRGALTPVWLVAITSGSSSDAFCLERLLYTLSMLLPGCPDYQVSLVSHSLVSQTHLV